MTYSAEVLADAPVGYWRLGDPSGTTMTDSSGNTRNGTYVNTPTLGATSLLASDAANKAVSFDGSNEHATVTYGSWMNAPTAFAAECWIKTSATGLRAMVDRDHSSGRVFQFRLNAGIVEFIKVGGTGGIVTATSTVAVNNNVARHIVATYDGSNIRIYIDGVLNKTQSAAGTLGTGNSPFQVGGSYAGGTLPANNPFLGTIDEVALYNTALSGARITAHYDAGITAPPGTFGGTLDVTLPMPQVAFTGSYTIGTDTSNGMAGLRLGGYVMNEAPDPVMPTPPAIWTPTRSDDMALYLPPPTIVDGRIQ